MANSYPIFLVEGKQRIAINPDRVINIAELERGRVSINFSGGGAVTVAMTLEDVIARLAGMQEPAPNPGWPHRQGAPDGGR
jgi:hypothetical protein